MSRAHRFLLGALALSWVGLLLQEAEQAIDDLEGRCADLEGQLAAARQVRATETEQP